ncbi:MAG: phosphodiester glycosidase family protein [Rhizobiales bacterium]|nr:phosphodiester glycosidase family protein [Hyphomicrobiales bacterium]
MNLRSCLVLLAGFLGLAGPAFAAVPERTAEPDMALLLAAGQNATSDALMPGLVYRVIELPAYGLKVHAWTFDQDRFRMRVALQKTAKGSHVRDLIGPAPDVLAINGGFFERARDGTLTPSGLVIMHGVENAPAYDRGGSGIIHSGASGVGIGYRKDLTARGTMAEAIQVGPILVDPGGKVGVSNTKHDRQNRSAACLTPGKFTIVAVDGGLSLYQLAVLMASPAAEGGLGCDIAINLDGGPSTQASSRAGGQGLDILGGTTVQNALIVSAKPPLP